MTETSRQSRPSGRTHSVRVAEASLQLLAAVLLVHLVDGPVAYVAVLYVGAAAGALAAARQVRQDDVLGWTMAAAVTLAATSLVAGAHRSGLPGDRPLPWDVWAAITLGCGVAMLGAVLARWRRHQAATDDISARPAVEHHR